jgi:alpha-glucosidase
VSGAEENLLCYPLSSSNISAPDDPTTDRYHGENIFVHELSHTIKQMGIEAINPQFRQRVQNAYQHAQDSGLWHDTYSMQDAEEYWAEGVESYFDANLFVHPPNGIHNEINTRAKLKQYDPQLYDLIDEIFHGGSWRPPCFR